MQMTFLEIVQRAARECGMASVPSAVTSQSGDSRRLVDWVATAWEEIQNRHKNWRWLRSRFTLSTSASDGSYAGTDATDSRLSAAVTRFARWWLLDDDGKPNATIYLTASGVGTEGPLPYIPWDYFRTLYLRGTQNDAFPARCSIDPQNNLRLGPVPDAAYTVNGEYQMSAQALSVNGDVPELPDDYHMLLVYRAMENYGQYKAAVEVMNRGMAYGNRMMRQLENDQLPQLDWAGPLA